ncbi:MAG: mannose-6-phosphate isomerase, class I [Solirubrobacterales bacterium]|nr:mannose-6-phosphate isomerase, class I [Solirubrobacterales bacterium]
MDLLRPVIRPYAWGSTDAIAELQGRPVPARGPEAELWMGAHPSAPSGIGRDEKTLDALIAADPERELGADCAQRFGGRLPFLLKVLSAAKALSIQVHPSRDQAESGFAVENARGLPPGDPARNYVDDWPKPELLYALTPFEVAAGMRDPVDAARLLRFLAVDQLEPLAARLEASPGSLALAAVLGSVLEWPDARRPELVAAVVAACARLAAAGGRYAGACAAAARVAADHRGDLGVIALLLMRHAVLRPGQAVFLPAGGLHAYLRGTGIELLANSDNVIRAGLTGKHIDVPELLNLADPAVAVPVLEPRVLADGVSSFDTPAPEFRLYLVDLAAEALTLPGSGPRILLCLEGSATLRTGQDTLRLRRGESCFVSAADGPARADGRARLALAATAGSVSAG